MEEKLLLNSISFGQALEEAEIFAKELFHSWYDDLTEEQKEDYGNIEIDDFIRFLDGHSRDQERVHEKLIKLFWSIENVEEEKEPYIWFYNWGMGFKIYDKYLMNYLEELRDKELELAHKLKLDKEKQILKRFDFINRFIVEEVSLSS